MVDAILLYIPCGAPESVLERGIGAFVLSGEYRYDTANLLAASSCCRCSRLRYRG
jgi:hypothetical protein